ncbi:MAG TPA: aldehyde dehydrogenase family protein [Gemmatimonadales bacterium]|nr:aldehyde dehydrogenase family protein [Gemmatimonadales bacterium]
MVSAQRIGNWIDGNETDATAGGWFDKRSPVTGEIAFRVARSCRQDELARLVARETAVRLANESPFGLTASVHTRSVHRAMAFLARIRSGVAVVNGATYGSEPHMPFGGLRDSGNGLFEAGPEALDVYSGWKTVYINYRPDAA